VIDALHQNLETTVLPSVPKPPSVAVTQPESKKTNETAVLEGKKRKSDNSAILLAAKKSVPASPQFELLHVHDPTSFYQRLTQNTKCLQIALFFIVSFFNDIYQHQ
jgi:hypothetical protein